MSAVHANFALVHFNMKDTFAQFVKIDTALIFGEHAGYAASISNSGTLPHVSVVKFKLSCTAVRASCQRYCGIMSRTSLLKRYTFLGSIATSHETNSKFYYSKIWSPK